ncbi:MAG TPA: DUF4369 domain-containing protein, partial [Chitinophagaceae bacterium]|nr:DUF4369 domain-containing protein [Chitinophagaceae bacterium]
MKPLTVFIIALLLSSAVTAQFKLNGMVTGFPDSTLIYLDDLTDGSFTHLDSTYIINGKFSFTGKLSASPLRAAIRTKDIAYRCYVWLENSTMDFTGDKNDFRNAVLKGSKTQLEADEFNASVKTAKNRREAEYSYVRTHPNSIISANILNVYSSTWGKDTSEMLYKSFTDQVKQTYYGKQVYDYIMLVKNIKVGDAYVDFSQPDTKGRTRKLSDYKGKVVLL